MNFFKQLSETLGQGLSIKITAIIKDGQMTVGVVPSSKDNKIPMLLLNGTPEEIDEGFFDTIKTPLEKASGLITNANEVIDELDNSDEEEEEKPKKVTKKSASGKKTEAKENPEAKDETTKAIEGTLFQ